MRPLRETMTGLQDEPASKYSASQDSREILPVLDTVSSTYDYPAMRPEWGTDSLQ